MKNDDNRIFSSVGKILTDHDRAIRDIKRNRMLPKYFIESNLVIFICTIVFGAVLGTYVGGFQILINALKIPLLFFLTLYISLPIFYIISVLSNSGVDFLRLLTLLTTGYATAAVIIICFTPLVLLFIITGKDYAFTIFLMVGVLGLAGYFSFIYIFYLFI